MYIFLARWNERDSPLYAVLSHDYRI